MTHMIYAHILKDERAKFDSKMRKCIMLAYGSVTKGYRLYDLTQRKIIHSSDVQFNKPSKNADKVHRMSLTMIIN